MTNFNEAAAAINQRWRQSPFMDPRQNVYFAIQCSTKRWALMPYELPIVHDQPMDVEWRLATAEEIQDYLRRKSSLLTQQCIIAQTNFALMLMGDPPAGW